MSVYPRVVKTFDDLYAELQRKAADANPESGTVQELAKGVHGIGKKIVEEAAEVWMAAEYETDDDLALEASQLLYHVQVMLIKKGIPLEAVYEKL